MPTPSAAPAPGPAAPAPAIATGTVRVDLAERGYDIHVGPGLIDRAGALIAPLVPGRRLVAISDEHVAPLHLAALQDSLAAAGLRCETVTVPAGEVSKSFAQLEDLMDRLLALGLDRRTPLLALGGGVIGDLVGFAAAIALRGLPFLQVPTSLLAQVDSSVGGKTGINSRHGKNLIGAFHQPLLVLADTDVLDSLPLRELRAGYAEVVKYGAIDRPDFFAWLEENGAAVLAGEAAARIHAIQTSCAAKAAVVAADERETGARALLNLGHTFGHALEAETGYGDTLLHGEAVAIGMVLAFDLSVALGLCPAADADRLRRHLEAVGLPVSPRAIRPDWDIDRLIGHMGRDKKVQDGRLTFILAHGLGRSFVSRDVTADQVRPLLAAACGA